MKKKNILIAIAILMVLFIGKVRALEEPFKLDWKKENLVENLSIGTIGNAKFQYKDGYITLYSEVNENDFRYFVNYYKKDGTLVTSKTYNDYIVINATTDNEYVYAIIAGYDEYEIALVKLDSTLNVVKTYDFSYDEAEMFGSYIMLTNVLGLSTMNVINDTINLLGENILQIDTNLKSSRVISFSESRAKKYFEKLYYLEEFSYEDNMQYMTLDKNDKYYVYSGINTCGRSVESVYDVLEPMFTDSVVCKNESILILSDSNNRVKWFKDFDENEFIIDVKLVGDYVVGIKMTYEYPSYPEYEVTTRAAEANYDAPNIYTEIVVYDLKGNLVQTIDNDSLYLQLAPVDGGFMVNSNVENKKVCVSRPMENNILAIDPSDNCAIDTSLEVYTIPYTITPEINGKGHLEVASSSRAGSNEVFKVIADEGWKVESIKITDEEGTVIEYKGDTFTMPSSNVTIVVNFVRDVLNPNTSDFWIIGTISLAVVFGTIIIINRKKLKFLK